MQQNQSPGKGQASGGHASAAGRKQDGRRRSGAAAGLSILYRICRVLFIPALCLLALIVGLTIGYSAIGGGDAADVFKFETWKHLYDLVFEGT
ncbi:MAG: hypothetical protein BAA02_01315 [Paenibacillaceae bacterium ZCTH02-B3]|nr:MAG: hypothetical protein BAA02_01315 [Paenibacillaceae bacterium ZCTH02-B3]